MHTKTSLPLFLLAACGQLLMSGSASGDTKRPPPSSPKSAHDRFAVLDVKIGMPVEMAGFTCTKEQPQTDRHCVKFLDSRCAQRPTKIGQLKYGEKSGPGCYLDYSANATYLDSKLLQAPNTGLAEDTAELKNPARMPLVNLHVVGTQSRPSKVYRIWYMLAPDGELTADSKLSAALIAKYGEPSQTRSNDLRWRSDGTSVKAHCESQFCEVLVEDSAFEDLERHTQEESDAKAQHDAAPAPKL